MTNISGRKTREMPPLPRPIEKAQPRKPIPRETPLPEASSQNLPKKVRELQEKSNEPFKGA